MTRDEKVINLYDLHTLSGLLPERGAVDKQSEILCYHASVEWSQNTWWIRHLSLNSTWLISQKTKKNKQIDTYKISKEFINLRKNHSFQNEIKTESASLKSPQLMSKTTIAFQLNSDKALTYFGIQTTDKTYILHSYSQQYMMSMLARQPVENDQNHLNKLEQGWIFSIVLDSHLEIAKLNLNNQIYQAHEPLTQPKNAEQLIQQRARQVHLNCRNFENYKGDNLGLSSVERLANNVSIT